MNALSVVAIASFAIDVRTIAVPEPGPHDVAIRVTTSWISNGTESSFIRGERIAGDTPRGLDDPSPFPHVPGYQKVGVVERVGTAVTEFSVGDSVFATVSKVEGMFYDFGGHVSPAVTHKSQVWKLPEGLDPAAASGLVLTQVGVNCGIRPALELGDAAIVMGDGLVGQWAAQTLRRRGARVLLVGRRTERLALWEGDSVDARTADIVATAREFAPGGAQVLVDTVGSLDTIYALLPTLRHGAHLVSAGFYGEAGKIDLQRLRAGELTVHTPAGWSRPRLDTTLAWLANGSLTTLPLVTHRLPVAQAAEAYSWILEKRPGVLGVLLEWPA